MQTRRSRHGVCSGTTWRFAVCNVALIAGCASGKKADLAQATRSAVPTDLAPAEVLSVTPSVTAPAGGPPISGGAPNAGSPAPTTGATPPSTASAGSGATGAGEPPTGSVPVAPAPSDSSGADTPGASTPGASTPGASTPGASAPGANAPGSAEGSEEPGPSQPGEPAEPEPEPSRELCRLAGNEVGIIGDSYVDITTFVPQLQALAREAGALAPGDSYVDHSLLGASMDGVPSIPSQWPEALADARRRGAEKIRLVIMDGGGNDVLLANRQCLGFPSEAAITPPCKDVVTRALARGEELFAQMARDGVEAVIYFFYPHLPAISLFGGANPNTMVDYSLPFVREQCESQSAFACHFIDLRPGFDDGFGNGRADLIGLDGVHPNDAGSAIMADAVWAVMQDECLASE